MDKWIKENKISTIIILIVVAVFVVVTCIKQPTKIENQVSKTSSSISDIDAQTKCANAASTYFNKEKQESYNQTYQSHWNKEQNKCFIKITSSYPQNPPLTHLGTGVELDDAIEGVYYGSLIIDLSNPDPKISVCMYGKSDGDGHGMQQCTTTEQFDAYMTTLMNN